MLSKNKIYNIGIIGFYILFCITIYQNNQKPHTMIQTTAKTHTAIPLQNDIIGSIKIDKLNLIKPLYKIDSSHNQVDENITILKDSTYPDQEESILFLAAHSGNSNVSFFEHLDELKKEDLIQITYRGKKYQYQVQSLREEKKNGYIHINKTAQKQLILTTCSPNHEGKQLIIESILI